MATMTRTPAEHVAYYAALRDKALELRAADKSFEPDYSAAQYLNTLNARIKYWKARVK